MGHRQAKSMLFDGFAEVAESLGNGRRVELIDLLSQGEHHVKGLAAEIDQSVANTSSIFEHSLRQVSFPLGETGTASITDLHPKVLPTFGAHCGSLPKTTSICSTNSQGHILATAAASTRSAVKNSSDV